MRRALILLLLLLPSASALNAQVVSGTLIESGTETPLPGGVMSLLDEDSVLLERTRTDSAGAFAFTLRGSGEYRLHAEHLGFRAAASPKLDIGTLDTLRVEFSLSRDVVVLEPLVVKGRSSMPLRSVTATETGSVATSGVGGSVAAMSDIVELSWIAPAQPATNSVTRPRRRSPPPSARR